MFGLGQYIYYTITGGGVSVLVREETQRALPSSRSPRGFGFRIRRVDGTIAASRRTDAALITSTRFRGGITRTVCNRVRFFLLFLLLSLLVNILRG